MSRLRITPKLLLAVLILAAAAAAIAWQSVSALQTYNRLVDTASRAAQRSLIGAQIDSLINAVVMESRGIYMSSDAKQAEKFGKPLLAALAELKKKADVWLEVAEPEEKREYEAAFANLTQFITFRTELVRLSQEESTAKAREFGDNDANRKNRQALNATVQRLTQGDHEDVERLTAELHAAYASAVPQLIGIAAVGIVLGLGFAVVIAVGGVTRPLVRLNDAVQRMAKNDFTVTVPGTARGDEIGLLANAVEVFKQAGIERANLEREAEAARQREEEQRLAREQHEREAIEERERLMEKARLDAEQRVRDAEAALRQAEAQRRAEEEKRRAESEAARKAEMQRVAEEFERAIGGVVAAVANAAGEMQGVAEEMVGAADSTSERSTAVAAASEEASANVQVVASAAEEPPPRCVRSASGYSPPRVSPAKRSASRRPPTARSGSFRKRRIGSATSPA